MCVCVCVCVCVCDLQANSLSVTLFLNELLDLICLYNGIKYSNQTLIILFNIEPSFSHC